MIPVNTEDPDLAGSWFLSLNANCGAGLIFGRDHSFVSSTLCSGGTPANAMQTSVGTYTATATTWTANITKSTCPDAEKSIGDAYTATAQTLTFTEPSQVIVFSRNTATGSSGVITLGCFHMGMFTESPLAPL